jgi:asparagine synthase (glutamine-hydrolysing)
MLSRLNGMFAFAIWDKLEKKLVCSSSWWAVKPLYYSFYNETFYFASEQKHYLLRSPLKIAQDGIEVYFQICSRRYFISKC